MWLIPRGPGSRGGGIMGAMAGKPLFSHVARGGKNPPPHFAPLELLGFCGYKTPKPLFKLLRRRTGLQIWRKR